MYAPANEGQFVALVERFGTPLWRLAIGLSEKDEGLALELLQQGFLAIYKGITANAPSSAWVYRTALNGMLLHQRHANLPQRLVLEHEPLLFAEDDSWLQTAGSESVDLVATDLEGLIAALPEKYAYVLWCRDVLGLDEATTTDALGLTPATLRQRLHRARLHLLQRLT